MRPRRINTATSTPTTQPPHPPPRRQTSHHPSPPPQTTLWDFFPLRTRTPLAAIPATEPNAPTLSQDTNLNNTNTPPSTPTAPAGSQEELSGIEPPTLVQTSLPMVRNNRPWGDIWDAHHPGCHFRILSKNTNTINPNNLDMIAITNELNNIGASVFAAQETNINWNPTTLSLITAQCQQASKQVHLSTASSNTNSKEWHHPGGSLLLTLNKWTSRVINRGMDNPLG